MATANVEVMTAREAKRQIRIRGAIHTLARQHAVNLVKERLRCEGHKVTNYTAAQLRTMGEELIASDPLFIAKVKVKYADVLEQLFPVKNCAVNDSVTTKADGVNGNESQVNGLMALAI